MIKKSLQATLVMSRTQLVDSRLTKVFSIVATLFLPPTLIASVYGMNFSAMPELDWSLGYPVVLIVMLCSSLGPFWYFKLKHWI